MEGDLMFSKILVAVGGPDDAEETLSVVSGLAKAFNSEVLVVHMRERVVTSAATIEKETIPEAFRFGVKIADQLVQAGIKAKADIRGHRPDRLAEFILDEAKKFNAELIIIGGEPPPRPRGPGFWGTRQKAGPGERGPRVSFCPRPHLGE